MTGMVLGVTVDDRSAGSAPWDDPAPAARAITLEMTADPGRFGEAPALAFAVAGGAHPAPVPQVPGPTLVLTRDEPVAITLINRMREATAIHWHGMELVSYYDGVHGFGGSHGRVTPMIEPGQSFVVRFTPPRAGTFIYHNLHDRTQLASGLYGALLVLDPGVSFDRTTDHVLVIGRGGPQREAPLVVNNEPALRTTMKAGTTHRIRLINITPDDTVSAVLVRGGEPVMWKPLTKDGVPAPAGRQVPMPARQTIGVGETYDFEIETPAGRHTLWLELRTPGGRWLSQAQVIVR
jgi:FtsP/CotA-like multicopper oxidase with cupredoxin domain